MTIAARPCWRTFAMAAVAALLFAAPLAAARDEGVAFADRPLAGPGSAGNQRDGPPAATGPSVTRTVASLAGVAVLIVGCAWVWRRTIAAGQRKGFEGVTLVSRSLLTPRHQVLVVRVGRRLLVVGDSGHGMNLLCEVTDPDEAAVLLGEAVDGPLGDEEPDAYAAALIPGGASEPVEAPPELETSHREMRSLIERVRGLAGQVNQARTEAAGARRTDY
jgi:flagellar biogenesis protein FliO